MPNTLDNDESMIEPDSPEYVEGKPTALDMLTDRQYYDLERLAKLGFSLRNMATWIGVSDVVFNNWYNGEPKLKQLIDNARTKAVGRISEVVYGKALQGDFNFCKLFLVHVGKWTQPAEINNTTVNMQINNVLAKVPSEEIAKLLREVKQDNGVTD
jgi:hypothetical protein